MVGNNPNYTNIDVLRCFLRLHSKIGRQELVKELNLGEGTIRSKLEILKSRKLIDSTKKGHFLSKKGISSLNDILKSITIPKKVTIKNIYPRSRKVGIVIRNVGPISKVYMLRDVAVKNNADGALILKFDKKLRFLESNYKLDFSELEHEFDFGKRDILVVGFSGKLKDAETGALSIALELKPNLKKFINTL